MANLKDRIKLEVSDWTTHAAAFRRTGFWGVRGGAGGICLARNTGRLLLAQRSHQVLQPGTWGTIGGAIDHEEHPEETVLREMEEELGVLLNVADLHLCYVFRDKRTSFTYHNYVVLVDEEFHPVLNWEVSAHAWIEFAQWPTPLHFGMETWLRDIHGERTLRELIHKVRHRPRSGDGEE